MFNKSIRKIKRAKLEGDAHHAMPSVDPISVDRQIDFIDAIEKYALTDRGDRVVLTKALIEYARLISNLKIHEVLTDGACQSGKTLIHNLLQIYLTVEGGYNTLWVYAQERTLHRMVAIQFKPMIAYWLANKGIDKRAREGKSSAATLYQYGHANAIFSYASTSKPIEGKRGAAAGSAIVSFSADIAFLEERSQWQPGSDAPVYRRLDASRIDTHPIRQLGTNGALGTGIHEAMRGCQYEFSPHCICSSCGEEIHLHPFGTLLKPTTRTKTSGEKIVSYLSSSGKPDSWYCHDPENPAVTAYFACPSCESEIAQDTRVEQSYFRCLKTGIKLQNFLELDFPHCERLKVAIHILPLLKASQYNLAAYIITQGIETTNPADWQEQQLGIPSESESVKISISAIARSLRSPIDSIPSSYEKVTLCGIDCGRQAHWVWIASYYLPPLSDRVELNNNQISDLTYRVVEWAGDLNKSAIDTILEEYGVDYGIIDNEPDIESSARLCDSTVLEMADQRDGQLEEFKLSTAKDGGQDYPVWKIRNDKFLRQVLSLFTSELEDGYPLVRFRNPDSWDKWLKLNSERSPVRHLTSLSYNPESRKFVRPDDHVDDLYYACAFCEAAFFIWCSENTITMWD